MKGVGLAVLACLLIWPAPPHTLARARPVRATVAVQYPMPGRVDSLAGGDGEALALVNRSPASPPFLPHDDLALVNTQNPGARPRLLPLPPYLAAPGLVFNAADGTFSAIVDATLLTVAMAGQPRRQNLGLQAVGWPAAIVSGAAGAIYVIGQQAQAREAEVIAFGPSDGARQRARWHAELGVTHAGAWIGMAGHDALAVYMPDQHDAAGTIELLDLAGGNLKASYAVPMPPSAADAPLDRLYLAGAGQVRALALGSGGFVAATPGDPPLAAQGGLVAYTHGRRLIIADRFLHTLVSVPYPLGLVPTALAWQSSRLLVGHAGGITRLTLPDRP
jgi:hypothetical protein